MRNKPTKRAALLGERHCWAHGPERYPPGSRLLYGSTCLLPAGHEGAHQWTPDEQIVIQFSGEEEEGNPPSNDKPKKPGDSLS